MQPLSKSQQPPVVQHEVQSSEEREIIYHYIIIIVYLQACLTNPAALTQCQKYSVNSICLLQSSTLTRLANEIFPLHRSELLQD